jgi:septal ring factor EnvC (AmiA/AmiB activator)
MKVVKKPSILGAALATPLLFCMVGVAAADKLEDFKEAAGKTGCEAIPYSSERSECKSEQDKKNTACKDLGCERPKVEKLLETLKEKRQNLADAKSRNNQAAIPDLEKAIKELEDALKARKAEAQRRVDRCEDCIEAREKVQKVFREVKGESDPALKPYVDQLVQHYDRGAQEHVKPLEEARAALANCEWVASISI